MGTINAVQKSIRLRLHPSERRVILFAGDAIAAVMAMVVAIYLWGQVDWLDFTLIFLDQRIPSWFFFLPVVWMILNVEMYDIRRAGRRRETVKGVAVSAAMGILLYVVVFFLSDPGSMPRRGVAWFVLLAACLMILWRFTYISIFTAPGFMRRVLIVGAGRSGCTLTKIIKEIYPPPFYLVGLIDDDLAKRSMTIEGFPVLGGCRDLPALLEKNHISDVIFAISNEMSGEMFQALLQAEEDGVEVTTMASVYEEIMGRVPIFLLRSDWILRSFVDQAHANGFYELVKRLLDVIGGMVGVLILLVSFPFIALAILVEFGLADHLHSDAPGQEWHRV